MRQLMLNTPLGQIAATSEIPSAEPAWPPDNHCAAEKEYILFGTRVCFGARSLRRELRSFRQTNSTGAAGRSPDGVEYRAPIRPPWCRHYTSKGRLLPIDRLQPIGHRNCCRQWLPPIQNAWSICPWSG